MNEKEYSQLTLLLAKCQLAYENSMPLISDEIYDALFAKLQEYERSNNIIAHHSPSKIIGYILDNAKTKPHLQPMLSLESAAGVEYIAKFIAKMDRFLNDKTNRTFIAQHKIDGVSVSLRYYNGVLKHALLRGNGMEGEDITNHILTLHPVLQFNLLDLEDFELRGELYIPKHSCALVDFANARNAVAGAVRLLDTNEFKKRDVRLLIHGFALSSQDEKRIYSSYQYMDIMHCISKIFPVVSTVVLKDISEAEMCFKGYETQRDSWEYLADGVVFKVNELALWDVLNISAKAPRYAFAVKFQSKTGVSEIIDVEWSVGRTGIVTPVLIINPLYLDGSTIQRITLHNVSEFQRYSPSHGDLAVISKACDVIPAVMDIIKNNDEIFIIPEQCPSCNTALLQKDKFLICAKGWSCKDQVIDRIFHMLNRDAFDIEGLGLNKIAFLYDKNVLREPADIFKLDQCIWLCNEPGWGTKSVEKLFAAINNRRSIPFSRFLYSLGIEGIGKNIAKKISQYISNWGEFLSWSADKILEIENMGEKTLQSIQDFIQNNNDKVLRLLQYVSTVNECVEDSAEMIHIALTGTFSVSKQALKLFAFQYYKSISFQDSVSKSTQFVVYGESAGSKLIKAQKLGIECMDEKSFREWLQKDK